MVWWGEEPYRQWRVMWLLLPVAAAAYLAGSLHGPGGGNNFSAGSPLPPPLTPSLSYTCTVFM